MSAIYETRLYNLPVLLTFRRMRNLHSKILKSLTTLFSLSCRDILWLGLFSTDAIMITALLFLKFSLSCTYSSSTLISYKSLRTFWSNLGWYFCFSYKASYGLIFPIHPPDTFTLLFSFVFSYVHSRTRLNLLVGLMVCCLLLLPTLLMDSLCCFFAFFCPFLLAVFTLVFSANLCLTTRVPEIPRFLLMFSDMFNSHRSSLVFSSQLILAFFDVIVLNSLLANLLSVL